MKNIVITISILIVLVGLVLGVMWWMGLFSFNQAGLTVSTQATVSVSPSPQASETNSVNIEIANFSFKPATVTVKKGTTITWTNKDAIGHNSASNDNLWKTEILGTGESASVTFDEPGTFGYHCTPHPFMKGTIVVTD